LGGLAFAALVSQNLCSKTRNGAKEVLATSSEIKDHHQLELLWWCLLLFLQTRYEDVGQMQMGYPTCGQLTGGHCTGLEHWSDLFCKEAKNLPYGKLH